MGVRESLALLEPLAKQIDLETRQAEEDQAESSASMQPGRMWTRPEQELGSRLKDARESKFLTQGELANLTKSLDSEEKGISRAVISLYEKGVNRPSPTELRLLCEALKVTPNYFIYGDEHPFDSESLHENARLGTRDRSTPAGYAWLAYVMANIHHNHYDAVMKLVLDLARGWNKDFDQGLQERANAELLAKAEALRQQLACKASSPAKQSTSKKK